MGVFLCFTLSQAGVVMHWLRTRESGWRHRIAINAGGAATTGMVTIIVVVAKFGGGAWVVVLVVPVLVLLFVAIKRTYSRELRVLESYQPPRLEGFTHEMIVPVARVDRAAVEAVAYALSVGSKVTAVHVATNQEAAARLKEEWKRLGTNVPLEIVEAPYRLIGRFTEFVRQRATGNPTTR